jgi:hypothetical protein
VQSGGPIPFSSWAGPRALARSRPRSPRAADRPNVGHPPVGTGPHELPRAAWHPPRRDPLSPPLFSPLGHAAAERTPPRAPPFGNPIFFTPLRPLSRVLEPPRHSSHPDRHLRPPEPASPSRMSPDLRRPPPLPGELFPELPIPGISYNFLTTLPLSSCRTSSATPATTGDPSPPTNAAARRRWHRLTVDPPFRCASVLSSLPGAFPVTPSRPPATPCRRQATAEHATAPSRARSRPRRPVAPLGWAARPWPSRRSADRAWQAAAPHAL